MTFPLKPASAHPSLQRRPDRAADRIEPRADPRVKVWGKWPGGPGHTWELSTTSDRIRILKMRASNVAGRFLFDLNDVEALTAALQASRLTGQSARCIRSIQLRHIDSGWIDVGAESGALLLRIRFAVSEKPGHLHTRLTGPSLLQLAHALEHFAATATKGTP